MALPWMLLCPYYSSQSTQSIWLSKSQNFTCYPSEISDETCKSRHDLQKGLGRRGCTDTDPCIRPLQVFASADHATQNALGAKKPLCSQATSSSPCGEQWPVCRPTIPWIAFRWQLHHHQQRIRQLQQHLWSLCTKTQTLSQHWSSETA